MRQDDFTSAVGALYEAALDADRWPRALERVRTLFDAAASVVFLQDNTTGDIPLWMARGTEAGESEYLEEIKDCNPRARFSFDMPPGVITWDYRVLSEDAMRRDPFYDWLHRVSDFRYFVGTRMFEMGSRSAFTSVEWTTGHGHAERRTIEHYARILPHIEQALRLTLARTGAEVRAATFESILNGFACGVIVFDAAGRPLQLNTHADTILSRGDGLSLARGQVEALKAADTRTLHQYMSAAARAAASGAVPEVATVALPRRSGRMPYLVTVVPMPLEPFPGLVDRPALALVIREGPGSGPPPEQLMRVFGLTKREAMLAVALDRGMSVREAAGSLGISPNTARVHLRNAFLKTGVHSQRELARLLVQLAAMGDTERQTLRAMVQRGT